MKINELLKEIEELEEYRVTSSHNPAWIIYRGNSAATKKLELLNTPMTGFNVRYRNDEYRIHDYFLYDKETDECIGVFSIEEQPYLPPNITNKIASGIKAVTPHMGLVPKAQRRGISTLAYSSFLQGGPWVFITDEHTVAASKLWDSLTTGNNISFYVDQITGKIVRHPDDDSCRLLGPKNRFKL